MNANTTVCVTGGSGFVGSHCVHELLKSGYTVRATIRSIDPARTQAIQDAVAPPESGFASRLSLYKADLLKDDEDENELILPAVDGTLRVLRAATAAGVKRVVLTSSYLAVGSGHKDYSTLQHESVWTDEAGIGVVGAYTKSKVRAERAAWEYAKTHASPELTVLDPHLILGPLLPGYKEARSSLDLIQQIRTCKMPIAPKIELGVVDVRDVAALHVLAMTNPHAADHRFILAAGPNGRAQGFTIQNLGDMMGHKVRTMPDGLCRFVAHFSADVKLISLDLGVTRKISTEKATRAFDYKFRSVEEAVRGSVESLKAIKA